MNRTIEIFNKVFADSKLTLSDQQLCKMVKFYEYLNEENKQYNLTAIIDPQESAIRHFVDSLMLNLSSEFLNAQTVLDVGSGAGFPGIPLAIFYDLKQFTLLDSLQKRINFLTNTIDLLNLNNVNCVHERAETFSKQAIYREQYDIVTARAVANLSILAEYCLPAVKCGGYFIAMKSKEIENEVSCAYNAISLLGGGNIEVKEYDLLDGRERQLIIVKKINTSPQKYPRRPGIPKKRPIT